MIIRGGLYQTPHLPFSSKTWLYWYTYLTVAAAHICCTAGRYCCKDAGGMGSLACTCTYAL